MITWMLVVLALAGTVLNVRQDRRGFWLWVVSNAGLMIVNLRSGDLAQGLMFLVYLLLALWGLVAWEERKKSC